MATALSTHRFAQRTERFKASTIREMLKVTQLPDVISFAGGLPAPELFPVDEIAAASDTVMRERGAAALQYSVTEGIPEMRTWVADRLTRVHGEHVSPDDVIVTGGSQQALDLYAKVFIDPGDVIAVEDPTYLGALQAFDAYQPRYLTIEADAHGIIPEALEAAFERADPLPKFLYLCPNFENPTGAMLADDRRDAVVAICTRFGVPIFEDDPYGELPFSGTSPRSLLSRDSGTIVTYAGTGSKMVAPGLRIAWMVIPDEELREKIIPAKQGVDLHTGSYAQYVFAEYVRDEPRLEAHLAKIRAAYASRAQAMADALAATMPAHVRWNTPVGGMFFWASVGAGIDTGDLFELASREHVVFVPGRPFYAHKDRGDGMRLNFSACDEERIRIGIARLAHAMRELGG